MIRAFVVAVILGVGAAAGPVAAQARQVRALAATSDVAVRLWVPSGHVELRGWDFDSVHVAVTPTVGSHFNGGGSRDAMKFALERGSATDTVLAGGQLRIFVPRGARVFLKSTTTSVNVEGLAGELEVITVAGATEVRQGRGHVRIESIDGGVQLHQVQGSITVRGGAGAVLLNDVGGTVDVATVSAEVRVMGLAIPLAGRIETVGGMIFLFGTYHPLSRLELSTHSGPISLGFAGDRPVRVEGNLPSIPAENRNAPISNGVVTVRTFKGQLNVRSTGGI